MALVQEKSDRVTRRDPNAVKAVVAALAAKFGNRVVTSRIREVRVIRGETGEDLRLLSLDNQELLTACYGTPPRDSFPIFSLAASNSAAISKPS